MKGHIFDDTACYLGEGPLWHPERGQLYWFDIENKRLHTREAGETRTWQFDGHVSAAGWVDRDRLLMASETDLSLFDLSTGTGERIAPLEADNPITRSNDGRADPYGGFWIGTMGKKAEAGAGAIYRYYRGELRKIFPDISITNTMCFAPGGEVAYFSDTVTNKVMRVALDKEGWPKGDPEVFLADGNHPDGAVVDAAGNIWIAQWGAWRVQCYGPDGAMKERVEFNAAHTSCPAFGGPDLTTLFCTTAQAGMSPEVRTQSADHGKTFTCENVAKGQAEHQVIL